ncbi:TOBE domain-containing protein [Pollutimonas bauzanensis]|uniref:Molybdenum-pterin binding domain-containing protein n=1 Tax=Pollutimonas bauzanensis TaxID=658167 RepID=A0A1M5T771_9BURK|nr:TOBE domain-containing protein [Pollutimonas bauzanensis]SHH46233.1 molybdenum-pterin binding domain-containing protein [Pollutimonas bauzanensis]
MKTSARNQFFGKISAMKKGAVNDEIQLETAEGHRLTAIITRESSEDLGLQVGGSAFALIKASWIIIVSEDDNVRFSARNRMRGQISRLQPGAVNTEVVVDLEGGGSIAAIVTNESARTLELAEGGRVGAIFKASSVIIGAPA